MILNTIAEKLKRQSKDDFKGRHFEAWLIVQAVAWYLRYPLSYRDLEEMFRERGFEVDHSTINRWVLAYAPVIEKRLRQFRRPHCGSVRIDETYVKIRGKWRYLYRGACRKHFWRQLSPSQGRYFHALLTFCSPKRRASKSFWSLTV
ncbi:IS6 family transposase, partial [Sphingobium sp. HBC34]